THRVRVECLFLPLPLRRSASHAAKTHCQGQNSRLLHDCFLPYELLTRDRLEAEEIFCRASYLKHPPNCPLPVCRSFTDFAWPDLPSSSSPPGSVSGCRALTS